MPASARASPRCCAPPEARPSIREGTSEGRVARPAPFAFRHRNLGLSPLQTDLPLARRALGREHIDLTRFAYVPILFWTRHDSLSNEPTSHSCISTWPIARSLQLCVALPRRSSPHRCSRQLHAWARAIRSFTTTRRFPWTKRRYGRNSSRKSTTGSGRRSSGSSGTRKRHTPWAASCPTTEPLASIKVQSSGAGTEEPGSCGCRARYRSSGIGSRNTPTLK